MTRTESVHKLEIQSIKEEFADVFKEELGLLICLDRGRIELKEGSSSKFYKPWPIPFTLRIQVEEDKWPMVNYNQWTRVNGQRL